MDIDEISSRQFSERFALKPERFSWLLGAGASATAGIPTGYQMIQEFRGKLFSHTSGISQREIDVSDPIWQQRIDAHLERHAVLPPKGAPSEYSKAFEALYPRPEDRRQYIANQVTKGTPSIGHRALGAFLTTKRTPCVFTTNFDQLVETSATVAAQLLPAHERANAVVSAIDNAERAERCLRDQDWPLIAKLHGDYQSVELKNTDDELKTQDEQLRTVLSQACQRFGLIVCGYSGRDDSVMSALTQVLRNESPYPGGIYWVCQDPQWLLPAVREFLEHASLVGVQVALIRGCTFDELASDLADILSMPSALTEHVFGGALQNKGAPAVLSTKWVSKTPVLRLSAVPVLQLPQVARRIQLAKAPGITEIRARLKEAGVWATVAMAGTFLAAFGKDSELLDALSPFGPTLMGEIALNPATDSWALGLVYDALARAICRGKPLYPRLTEKGHRLSVSYMSQQDTREERAHRDDALRDLTQAYGSVLSGRPSRLDVHYSEGVQLRLDRAEDKWWCVYEPTTFLDFRAAQNKEEDESDVARWNGVRLQAEDWRRERWAQKYNSKWSRIIDAWAALLASSSDGDGVAAYGIRSVEGVDARFQLGQKTAWSRPSHHHPYFERKKR
ncbi:SIR2 family NAD-dependent protein deacylase [Zoogloea sp.]|uniref:SIR2 family NAD-dependent protein deacylase n=1 Tax=Zoogloea sp. TaxID=49181 RepID=UPI002FDF1865